MGRHGPFSGGESLQGSWFTSWQIRKQSAWIGTAQAEAESSG